MVHEDWPSFVDKVKRYFGFSREEQIGFLIVTLVFGFLFSLRDWGPGDEVNVAVGLLNFFVMIIVFGISLFIHLSGHRLLALRLGYKPEFRMWSYGIFGAVIIAILSKGYIWLVLPIFGGIELHMMPRHRLGHFRYGINQVCIGLVAFMGPLASLLLAYFLKIVNSMLGLPIIDKIILVNLLLAVYTMLPIPPFANGARIFFWSRLTYFFLLGVVIAAALLIWISNNIFFILVGSVLVGAIIWFIYYIAYEEEAYDA